MGKKIQRLVCGILLAMFACVCARAESGRQEVGDDAKLLLRTMTFEMENTPLHEAMKFWSEMSGVTINVSQGSGEKEVTLRMKNTTIGEGLRQIKDQVGAVYRLVDGKILIAMPEEWKAIDAGQAKFEIWTKKDVATRDTADASKPQIYFESKILESKSKILPDHCTIDGKDYTEEELQKERPDLYAKFKEAVAAAKAANTTTTRRYTIDGKDYTDDQLQKAYPDTYAALKKSVDDAIAAAKKEADAAAKK